MLFEDEYFESEFDFGSLRKIELSEKPESQLRDAIMCTIEKIERTFRENPTAEIYYKHKNIDFGVEFLSIKNLSIDDKEEKERIFTKKIVLGYIKREDRIKGIIKRFGVERPADGDTENLKLYLKLEYFMFFMHFYVFPMYPHPQKFYDLYSNECKSSENVFFGTGDNSKYGLFIIENLSDEIVFSKIKDKHLELEEKDDWYFCVQSFFVYMYKIIKVLELILYNDGRYDTIISKLDSKTIDYINSKYEEQGFYNSWIEAISHYLENEINDIIGEKITYKDNYYNNNPIYSMVNYIVSFDISAVVNDYESLFEIPFIINDRKRPTLPEGFSEKVIKEDELYSFLLSEEFLNWLYGTSKSIDQKEELLFDSNIFLIIDSMWDAFELMYILDEMEDILIEIDGEKCVRANILASVVWTIINLDKKDVFFSKNTQLKNRKASFKDRERNLKNEINYYRNHKDWRGNKNIPMVLLWVLILRTSIDAMDKENDKEVVEYEYRMIMMCTIIIFKKLEKFPIIDRLIYLKKIYIQLKNDFDMDCKSE